MIEPTEMILYFCVKCKDIRYFCVEIKFVCPNCSDYMDVDE